jgi:hypothetical protein
MYLMASGSKVTFLDFVRKTPELYTKDAQTAGRRSAARVKRGTPAAAARVQVVQVSSKSRGRSEDVEGGGAD